MSIGIHAYIEMDIHRYAANENIAVSQAIIKLIQAGLDAEAKEDARTQGVS